MDTILCIETSTRPCSVALIHDKKVLFHQEELNGPSHATLAGSFVKSALEYAQKESLSIKAVAVSCGPGSYTGLRIGVSLAKGLCYGLQIPLIPIHTLPLLAATASKQIDSSLGNSYVCPMIDARRMEVYSAIYSVPTLKTVKEVSADIIDTESYSTFRKERFYICGDGAEKCISQLDGTIFIPHIVPLALNMGELIEDALHNQQLINDPAYFEPFYLKEFVATVSKKNPLAK